jgi:hypothetical protein
VGTCDCANNSNANARTPFAPIRHSSFSSPSHLSPSAVGAMAAELAGVGAKRGVSFSGGQSHAFVYDAPLVVEDLQKERFEHVAKPVGGVGAGSPYEIDIPFDGNTFLDMSSLRLRAVCRITRPDNSILAPTDVVAPINLFGSSLWSKAEVILDDMFGNSSSADFFNVKSLVETILSYEGDARETHLRTQMYFTDTPERYDTCTLTAATANAGFVSRYEMVRNSQRFDVSCPLSTDILRCSRHLAPDVKVTLRLTKADDKFLLMSARNDRGYKVSIESLELKYARISVDDSFKLPAIQIYPFTKTVLRRMPVGFLDSTYTFNVERGGLIPKQIIFFATKASAADGDYTQNPYNFEHFDIGRVDLRVNGKLIPAQGLTFDFSSTPPKINDMLAELYSNIGVFRTDRGCSVSREGYMAGQFMIAYDLTPDKCNGKHLHRSEMGTCSADFSWNTPLTYPIVIYALCVYDCVYIKRTGQTGFDLQYI